MANIAKKADFRNGSPQDRKKIRRRSEEDRKKIGRRSDDYFDSSDSAALALSAAAPAVTFWNAAMACAFISLAL